MMADFYIMMSDFYVHEDENTASSMVENFAEQLDELYDSGEANNKLVPFFITQGGGEDNPEFSLEPLYLRLSTVFLLSSLPATVCMELHWRISTVMRVAVLS